MSRGEIRMQKSIVGSKKACALGKGWDKTRRPEAFDCQDHALKCQAYITKGAIAQLGERYNGIVEVSGSIPLSSTNFSISRLISACQRGSQPIPSWLRWCHYGLGRHVQELWAGLIRLGSFVAGVSKVPNKLIWLFDSASLFLNSRFAQ